MSNPTSTQIQSAQIEAPPKPARFTITAEIEGFPVTVEVEGKADVLKAMIERLKVIGATPLSRRKLHGQAVALHSRHGEDRTQQSGFDCVHL